MKQYVQFLITLLILVTGQLSAQDNQLCLQNLSIFAENAKVKNYTAAYEPWMAVKAECPSLNVAIYTYGERILKDRLKNAAAADKAAVQQELIGLYDEWIKYFPTKKGKSKVGDILSSKAQNMIDFKIGTSKEIYDTFNEAYTKDAASFTNPKRLYNYFKTFYDLYKSGEGSITTAMLFDKYEEVSEKFEVEGTSLSKRLDVILKKEESGAALSTKDLRRRRIYDTNSNAISIFLKNLDAIIAKESSCENLIPLYQSSFEENKTNPVW